jgi:hypothetical protein
MSRRLDYFTKFEYAKIILANLYILLGGNL